MSGAPSYVDRAIAYAVRVVEGQEVAGKLERAACARMLRDIDRARALAPGFPYRLDDDAANRACLFIELLPHVKGRWARPQIIDGELVLPRIRLEDWQCFLIVNLFGWLHVVTGWRRFSRAYLEVARKNAKSTIASGIALYMLVADHEEGAFVCTAATTGDQARLVFDDCRAMAIKDRTFRQRFGVLVGANDITVPESFSTMRPLNAEASTQDGLNIHCAIVDELHAHKTRKLFDVINDALGARDQPLVLMITTAGTDRAGVCYEQRTYTEKLLTLPDSVVDETWFGIIYTLDGVGQDNGDDWRDPRNWRKANPNLGVSVRVDDLEAQVRKAETLPSAQANLFTKRLNIWVNADQQWINPDDWEACADRSLTLADVEHLPCMIGLDLASKVDFAARVYVFHDEAAGRYYLITRLYLPERAAEQSTNAMLSGWIEAGHVTVTDGEVTDFDLIEDEIRVDHDLRKVLQVGYDPWQATQLASHLLADGVQMVEVRQTTANMSEPMKALQALVLQRQLVHDGNPAMAWMMSNVVCHLDAKENVYPRKERPENKIDGPVAAIVALGRWVSTPGEVEHDADSIIVVG